MVGYQDGYDGKSYLERFGLADYAKRTSGCACSHQVGKDKSWKTVIFYDEKKPDIYKGFVIAHELGHVMAGHIGPNSNMEYFNQDSGKIPYCELIADVFACVMVGMNLLIGEGGMN